MPDLDEIDACHQPMQISLNGVEVCGLDGVLWPCVEARMSRELRAARAVIEAMEEWPCASSWEDRRCPDCWNTMEGGHLDGCHFGAALAAYRAVVEESRDG